jgi:hypothetical protein
MIFPMELRSERSESIRQTGQFSSERRQLTTAGQQFHHRGTETQRKANYLIVDFLIVE